MILFHSKRTVVLAQRDLQYWAAFTWQSDYYNCILSLSFLTFEILVEWVRKDTSVERRKCSYHYSIWRSL